MKHTCHAIGCSDPVPPKKLFCLPHWRILSTSLQMKVWHAYRRGQCDDKKPSRRWMLAAGKAVEVIAAREGQEPTLSPLVRLMRKFEKEDADGRVDG